MKLFFWEIKKLYMQFKYVFWSIIVCMLLVPIVLYKWKRYQITFESGLRVGQPAFFWGIFGISLALVIASSIVFLLFVPQIIVILDYKIKVEKLMFLSKHKNYIWNIKMLVGLLGIMGAGIVSTYCIHITGKNVQEYIKQVWVFSMVASLTINMFLILYFSNIYTNYRIINNVILVIVCWIVIALQFVFIKGSWNAYISFGVFILLNVITYGIAGMQYIRKHEPE